MQRLIRLATQEDLDQCVYIAGVFHEGSQYAGVTTYNPEDAYNHAVFCLNNPNKYFIVIEIDSKVVGFFIAAKFPVPWNKDQEVSDEQLFFILPDHATPRLALRVFRAWEDWCEKHDVVMMFFNPTSFIDHNVDRWDSFCHAIGFEAGGKSYKKVLRHAD